jgi:hypothetical protein
LTPHQKSFGIFRSSLEEKAGNFDSINVSNFNSWGSV